MVERAWVAKRSCVWLALLSCACAGSASSVVSTNAQSSSPFGGTPVPFVYAPTCPGAGDLTGELAPLSGLPLNLVEVEPTKAAVTRALEQASGPWFMFFFSGHGDAPAGSSSRICLNDEHLPVNDAIQALSAADPKRVRGAVFVLNACESADVDPSRSKIPLSIISASPLVVRTDSLFGESLAPALELAAEDWNCDGVVTDQEFFDALLAVLTRNYPHSRRPALPKLRRQAPSEIPLPIAARSRRECAETRSHIAALTRSAGTTWGELGVALSRQLALRDARAEDAELPSVGRDYYVVNATNVDAATLVRIRFAAEQAELTELPAMADVDVEAVAGFASFAKVYRLEVSCGFVRIRRLSDDVLVDTVPVEELARALPRRVGLSIPRRLFSGAVTRQRVLGEAKPTTRAVPCYEQTGQCFVIPPASAATAVGAGAGRPPVQAEAN